MKTEMESGGGQFSPCGRQQFRYGKRASQMKGVQMFRALALDSLVISIVFNMQITGKAANVIDQVRVYFSPDQTFTIECHWLEAYFIDKATGKRTRIEFEGHMMRDPMFAENRTGFILFDGTASMGAWQVFYKRNPSGGCFQIGRSLQDQQYPLWNNINRLLHADSARMFISVNRWDGGPTAEITVWASPRSQTRPVQLLLDIQQGDVSKLK